MADNVKTLYLHIRVVVTFSLNYSILSLRMYVAL